MKLWFNEQAEGRFILSIPLSIVIPVKNEAGNLPACLESVSDFSEVVVVDSGSTDTTREIARQFQRTVVDFVWDGKFPKKRNWTLRSHRFQNPWVLFLDADERMTPELRDELARTLPTTQHHAFWIGYRNWFMGRPLRFGDRMWKTALLRIGYGEYEKVLEDNWSALDMEIHEHLVVDGSVGVLTERLEHHDMRDLHAYYVRHNEYSTWEANRYLALTERDLLTFRQRLKYRMLTWPIFPLVYFVASYILKLGFLDGRAGFNFARGKMFYFYQIQTKINQLQLNVEAP